MMLKKFVQEGQFMPRGYGVAYREVHRLGAICYPIPLNVVVAWAHHIWQWLVGACWNWRTERDVICERCYELGRKEGERKIAWHLTVIENKLNEYIRSRG